MGFKKTASKVFQRFSSWKLSVGAPLPEQFIAIGAPHTSNWDAIFMVVAFWNEGVPLHFLVKNSVMRVPVLAQIARKVGGIAVDRTRHNGLVSSLIKRSEADSKFGIVLAPSGTRKPVKYWKSGFYRMALETGLPLKFGVIDSGTKTYGWTAEEFYVTGDVKADMEHIRSVYEGLVGVRPKNTSVPRLRAEDDESARAWLLGEG